MRTINYLTLTFSFVGMMAMLIMLFRTNMGGNFPDTKKGVEKTEEKSFVTHKIDGEVPEDEAGNMVTVFRTNNPSPDQTKVIVHKPSELVDYIQNNFLFYTDKVKPPSGFEWKLGMSPMYFTKGGVNKLTMAFLPTLVEKTRPANVIDYWESKGKNDDYYQKYYKPLLDSVQKAGFKSFVFDEGQLWP